MSKDLRIALIHPAKLPVATYGGTERVIWYLAKGLTEIGIDVSIVCLPESSCPFAKVIAHEFKSPYLPSSENFDLAHYFYPHRQALSLAHLTTIEGNGSPEEVFDINTVFVSKNHAQRHGATAFVYNGIDPADYIYSEQKTPALLFLGKASWRVKNVSGAVRIAHLAKRHLNIIGGRRPLHQWCFRCSWHGMLGGQRKAHIIAQSSALLFPVIWNEPFGLAIIEALVSGTPVFASPFGSLPELVSSDVGKICQTEREFAEALCELRDFRSSRCRDYAIEHFDYRVMARKYVEKYEAVLSGHTLNPETPRTLPSTASISLPHS